MIHRHPLQAFIALLVCIPIIGYPIWVLFDSSPPYIREHGEIKSAPTEMCGLPLDDPTAGAIAPGSCVIVDWTIRVIRNCPPSKPDNLTRRIRDSENVVHTIGPIRGVFGTTNIAPSGLARYFRIPSGAQPGPATYLSEATFACSFLQKYIPIVFRPTVVSVPNIKFDIADVGRPLRGMLRIR